MYSTGIRWDGPIYDNLIQLGVGGILLALGIWATIEILKRLFG